MGCWAACSGAQGQGAGARGGGERRETEIEHEPCDLTSSGAVASDADANGRPEIIKVMEDGREICRAVDINLDGTIDVFAYWDERGLRRRVEAGFDRDPVPDEVSIFEGGQLVRKERETNNDRRIDTWVYFEGGRPVREERDSTGDGYVDQWWSLANPKCPVVTTDGDGDGRPDKGSEIDLCAADKGKEAARGPAEGSPADAGTPGSEQGAGGGEPSAESPPTVSPAPAPTASGAPAAASKPAAPTSKQPSANKDDDAYGD